MIDDVAENENDKVSFLGSKTIKEKRYHTISQILAISTLFKQARPTVATPKQSLSDPAAECQFEPVLSSTPAAEEQLDVDPVVPERRQRAPVPVLAPLACHKPAAAFQRHNSVPVG